MEAQIAVAGTFGGTQNPDHWQQSPGRSYPAHPISYIS